MRDIRTIGVCGAGVMGSQLAALFAGAGLDVHLFDLTHDLAQKGLAGALGAKPPAFHDRRFARRIKLGAYDDDLERLIDCDLVIEAIAERLDWKRELYARLAPVLGEEAILSTNTSGLSLRTLGEEMPPELRERFLVTHFFNPPRYLRLVEMVCGDAVRSDVVDGMKRFLGETLGKGVVEARDTPNFIANRIGIYGMMLALELTRKMKLTVEKVDAITGPVMGRPKSATYRTADIVGLDVIAAVAKTAHTLCVDDESRDLFAEPEILTKLLEAGYLGQKTGAGFYKKEGKQISALDLKSFEYRPKQKPRMDGIGVARRFTDLGKKLHALVYNPDPAGEFAWELTLGTLSYAARRVGEIAAQTVDIDNAMKWGFGWQLGPFEVWDAIGVEKSVRRMEREGKDVPRLVRYLLEKGHERFYERDAEGTRRHFYTCPGTMEPVPVPEGAIVLADRKALGGEILRNWSASLVDLGDGVACLEFHSALQPELHPIDGAILDLLAESLDLLEEQGFKGLVISHDGVHFSAGANLAMILEAAKAARFDVIEHASRTFQHLTQRLRHAPFPVVAAPFSLCLGGGFELVAPADRVLALAELYCGAVEVGVGLIPGAGGNLRLLLNMTERYPPDTCGPMMAVQKAFETIAFAKVSGSAHEAVKLGYLREGTPIVFSRDHLIADAKAMVLELAEGYEPPSPRALRLPGEGGRLAIETVIDGFQKSGKISEHDALIGRRLARVLTGGERANGLREIGEEHLLDLERETFLSLAGEAKSQERMAHMLKKGKPLRN